MVNVYRTRNGVCVEIGYVGVVIPLDQVEWVIKAVAAEAASDHDADEPTSGLPTAVPVSWLDAKVQTDFQRED